jgi:multicomponent Na+:H+ antiporter subunit C
MESILAVVVGALFAVGTYLILRRSIVKLLLGLMLMAHGTNLLLFTLSGLRRGAPPLVRLQDSQEVYADPLPQALILTAIVIGFSLNAFTLVLAYRADQVAGSDDLKSMETTDR